MTRIGILTSGGDCPGLNAVLRAASRACESRGWELLGFCDGFEGLLPPADHRLLDRKATSGLLHLGGTVIGTVNKGHFLCRQPGRAGIFIPPEILGKARQTFQNLGLRALIVVGGDGSLSTALHMHQCGLPVVGVPKTIDNDIDATDRTFGFDSAVECVVSSLDRLHTTTASHKRIMIVEVMGRHAGWIALHGGLAGGADVILIPEIPFGIEAVQRVVAEREARGSRSHMIVIAEGARPRHGWPRSSTNNPPDRRSHIAAELLARELADSSLREVRSCVLGHLQRGGPPVFSDRILGTAFGVKAVELVEAGLLGHMASLRNGSMGSVPIAEAVHQMRRVEPGCEAVRAARATGISFGD